MHMHMHGRAHAHVHVRPHLYTSIPYSRARTTCTVVRGCTETFGPWVRASETVAAPMAEIEIDDETNRQLDKWVDAKRKKDFTSADRIRALLEAKGIKAEQVRPHVWEAPGQRGRGSSALTTTDDRPSPADRPEKRSIHGVKQTFGYVPPEKEQPWTASLTSNSGKLVAQEGSIVPVTGKAVDGAFRPPGMRITGEKRTGEGGGFREFDDAEATRRKQRALEVKAETSARKAEKKKCDYWCVL
mgnify:CR=1 FL=1